MIEIGQISRVTFYKCFLHRLDNSRLNQVQRYAFYLILSLYGIKFNFHYLIINEIQHYYKEKNSIGFIDFCPRGKDFLEN